MIAVQLKIEKDSGKKILGENFSET